MSQTNDARGRRAIALPPPGPECARYAAGLPLLGQKQSLLPAAEAARLRAHVASCAHCQTLLAAYDRLDAVLGRCFGPPQDDPTRLTEEIMEQIEERSNPFPPAAGVPAAEHPVPAHAARRVSLVMAVAAVLVIAVVAAALLAGRGLNPRGKLAPVHPAPPQPPVIQTPVPANFFLLNQLIMVAPNDGWAFGTYNTAACALTNSPKLDSSCRWQNAALHYDGHTWSRASLPVTAMLPVLVSSAPRGQIWAIASASPNAAGNPAYGYGYQVPGTPAAGSASNVLLRYAQGQWVVSDTPVPTMPPTDNVYIDSYGLNAFAMVSPTEGWAAGSYDNYNSGAYGLLLHLDQGRWTQATIPGEAHYISLQAISMSSPSNGWAVGVAFGSPQMTVILHDHDGQWTREDPGIPGSLNAVYAVSPSEAWAVGSANPSTGPGLILHYLNGRWTAVTGLQTNILHDVSMVSPTEGWVVGDGAMFLHYANGQWTNAGVVIHHFQLNQVALATATDGWAYGGDFNSAQASPGSVLFHYDGTRWTPYALDEALAQFAHG